MFFCRFLLITCAVTLFAEPVQEIGFNNLTDNNLTFAQYLNANAPHCAPYFASINFTEDLSNTLLQAAPTRNAISIYTINMNQALFSSTISSQLHKPFNVSTTSVLGFLYHKMQDLLVSVDVTNVIQQFQK